jgi:hypothetical protein
MMNQGEEMSPLEVLWTLGPVSRHEVHGMLEGRVEMLWKAVEKQLAVLSKASTATEVAEAQQAVFDALRRLNERAEQAIASQLSVWPN